MSEYLDKINEIDSQIGLLELDLCTVQAQITPEELEPKSLTTIFAEFIQAWFSFSVLGVFLYYLAIFEFHTTPSLTFRQAIIASSFGGLALAILFYYVGLYGSFVRREKKWHASDEYKELKDKEAELTQDIRLLRSKKAAQQVRLNAEIKTHVGQISIAQAPAGALTETNHND